MSRKTVIPDAAPKIDQLIKHLEDKYKPRQFEVQVLEVQDRVLTGKLFQVKEASTKAWFTSIKNVTGLGTAATIKLMAEGQDLEVEVFGGKWLDKVAVGAVSLAVLWPLIIVSGIGAWRQNALLDELYDEVVLFLAGHADPLALATTPMTHCPSCDKPITPGIKFCGNCGMKLVLVAGTK
jgi:hypothetical protein